MPRLLALRFSLSLLGVIAVVSAKAEPAWEARVIVDRAERRQALEALAQDDRPTAPANGLPDGRVAEALSPDADIAAAWYAAPTWRYRHGVLGDDIEAGRLVARLASGALAVLDLPETEVFEDITPRLADLDGDGAQEIVTIRSSVRLGGSVAVYGLAEGRLVERASTPFIGRANRWLNIAAIADFLGEGGAQIAYVETPHIGGTLRLWSLADGRLVERAALYGFSNHAIGSRELRLSAIVDLGSDGRPDLALPDESRRGLRIMSVGADGWRERAVAPVPGRIATRILFRDGAFLVGLDEGDIVILEPRER